MQFSVSNCQSFDQKLASFNNNWNSTNKSEQIGMAAGDHSFAFVFTQDSVH
jgi:hypothetical protein